MSYYVSNYSKEFKTIGSARKYALEKANKDIAKGKMVLSVPITNGNNRFVGNVWPISMTWETHYYRINENTGRRVQMERRWILKRDGTLGKKVMG